MPRWETGGADSSGAATSFGQETFAQAGVLFSDDIDPGSNQARIAA